MSRSAWLPLTSVSRIVTLGRSVSWRTSTEYIENHAKQQKRSWEAVGGLCLLACAGPVRVSGAASHVAATAADSSGVNVENSTRGKASMASTPLDDIKDEWARLAGGYDRQITRGLLSPRAAVRWQRVIRKLIGADAKDVLDVGTGTGLLAVEIAKAGHRVVGVDLTPEMLERARSRGTREGVDVTWLEGDAMNLPVENGRFDVTISRHVLWTMPDPAKALTEWIRVTAPNGRVVWIDSIWPKRRSPGSLLAWARHTALGRRLRSILRPQQPNEFCCHYDTSLDGELPFRDLTSVDPIVALLRDIGVSDVVFKWSQEVAPWNGIMERLRSRERYYAAWFTVTPELQARLGGKGTT
jgi:ubiquinone/menaquinone biosynthesis C-methylase UbiE